jgi:hypothetical protein
MLTFTSIGTWTSSGIWTLEFRYGNICTNFDHSPSATAFSGNARINGGTAYRYTLTNTQQIGTAPAIILGIEFSSFIPSASVAYWNMTASPFPNPYSTFTYDGTALSSLAASMLASVSFTDSDNAFGNLFGYLGHFGGPISFGMEPMILGRGGSCPV